MTNDEIEDRLFALEQSDLNAHYQEVFEWLNPGPKKNAVDALYNYCLLQQELIHNLRKENEDLKNPKPEPEQKFFPMSTSATKKRF